MPPTTDGPLMGIAPITSGKDQRFADAAGSDAPPSSQLDEQGAAEAAAKPEVRTASHLDERGSTVALPALDERPPSHVNEHGPATTAAADVRPPSGVDERGSTATAPASDPRPPSHTQDPVVTVSVPDVRPSSRLNVKGPTAAIPASDARPLSHNDDQSSAAAAPASDVRPQAHVNEQGAAATADASDMRSSSHVDEQGSTAAGSASDVQPSSHIDEPLSAETLHADMRPPSHVDEQRAAAFVTGSDLMPSSHVGPVTGLPSQAPPPRAQGELGEVMAAERTSGELKASVASTWLSNASSPTRAIFGEMATAPSICAPGSADAAAGTRGITELRREVMPTSVARAVSTSLRSGSDSASDANSVSAIAGGTSGTSQHCPVTAAAGSGRTDAPWPARALTHSGDGIGLEKAACREQASASPGHVDVSMRRIAAAPLPGSGCKVGFAALSDALMALSSQADCIRESQVPTAVATNGCCAQRAWLLEARQADTLDRLSAHVVRLGAGDSSSLWAEAMDQALTRLMSFDTPGLPLSFTEVLHHLSSQDASRAPRSVTPAPCGDSVSHQQPSRATGVEEKVLEGFASEEASTSASGADAELVSRGSSSSGLPRMADLGSADWMRAMALATLTTTSSQALASKFAGVIVELAAELAASSRAQAAAVAELKSEIAKLRHAATLSLEAPAAVPSAFVTSDATLWLEAQAAVPGASATSDAVVSLEPQAAVPGASVTSDAMVPPETQAAVPDAFVTSDMQPSVTSPQTQACFGEISCSHALSSAEASEDATTKVDSPQKQVASCTEETACSVAHSSPEAAEDARTKAARVPIARAGDALNNALARARTPVWWVRVQAATALGEFGGQEALMMVASLMQGDRNGAVRAAAAEASRRIDPNLARSAGAAVESWTQVLRCDMDWRVRIVAAEVLGDLGGATALEALATAMRHDVDGAVRAAAAGSACALAPLEQADEVRVLTPGGHAVRHFSNAAHTSRTCSRHFVRRRLAERAAESKNKTSAEPSRHFAEAREIVLQTLRGHEFWGARVLAARAAARIGGIDAEAALKEAARADPDESVRGAAQEAMATRWQ